MPRVPMSVYGFKAKRVTIWLSEGDWAQIGIPADLPNNLASERLHALLYHYAASLRRSKRPEFPLYHDAYGNEHEEF